MRAGQGSQGVRAYKVHKRAPDWDPPKMLLVPHSGEAGMELFFALNIRLLHAYICVCTLTAGGFTGWSFFVIFVWKKKKKREGSYVHNMEYL